MNGGLTVHIQRINRDNDANIEISRNGRGLNLMIPRDSMGCL